MSAINTPPLLKLERVSKFFPLRSPWPWSRARSQVRAVDDVSLQLMPGKTLSIVGESGSGKTTLGNLILRILSPTSGRISIGAGDVSQLKGAALHRYRTSVEAVFQDPWSSLNPRMRVGDVIAEPLGHQRLARDEVTTRVMRVLTEVGLDPGAMRAYPHEFSGGQRQRIAIARACASQPKLVVLDEPISSLDVSIGAQITNLLIDLQAVHSIAYLLIAHNLATVRALSHQMAVMYLGQIVEVGPSEELFEHPLHPYTRALMAVSAVDTSASEIELLLKGEASPPLVPATECRYRSRCPFAFDRCGAGAPAQREVAPGHVVRCHLY